VKQKIALDYDDIGNTALLDAHDIHFEGWMVKFVGAEAMAIENASCRFVNMQLPFWVFWLVRRVTSTRDCGSSARNLACAEPCPQDGWCDSYTSFSFLSEDFFTFHDLLR
jgi:hypothetical protein